jgi:SAM-dependent methyltransferase
LAETELGQLRASPRQLWQLLDDGWLDIDTESDPGAQTEAFQRQGAEDYRAHYQGASYLYLERIAQLVTRDDPHPLVFYDIGCGKGRALCVMARHPLAKVVGVERQQQLCEAARRNAERLRGRVAPIEIVCADAADVDCSDGHVFFFFNPFGVPTFRAVLRSIERSLVITRRRVTVIYYNAVHEAVLAECSWLECYGLLPTFAGVRVSFWRNRATPSDGGGLA